MTVHPARTLPFDKLWTGLQKAKELGLVSENKKGDLHLYCYTDECVYEKLWDPITTMARGLIVDPVKKEVVATPFPKFFNVGEIGEENLPDLPFEVFEKLDGSLIIFFFHNGEWHTATKGSFESSQAVWARNLLARLDLAPLDTGVTFLLEAIYPENRIVVNYPFSGLVLLGAYWADGTEAPYDELSALAKHYGSRVMTRYVHKKISDLLVLAKKLPASHEGFVLRYANGYRVKIKGDEYCRIHRLVSRLTPLAMWEAMMSREDLGELRKQLPEEFWVDFDAIIIALYKKIKAITDLVEFFYLNTKTKTDKEVGLMLEEFPEEVKKFIFPRRKYGKLAVGRARDALYRYIRPTGNKLSGYTPSYAMNRILEEAA